jgi:predicted MFS family arabinose efflux permease
MALYGMIFRAGPAVGAVLMGSLSERFGLRLPLAVGALVSCGFWALGCQHTRTVSLLLTEFIA